MFVNFVKLSEISHFLLRNCHTEFQLYNKVAMGTNDLKKKKKSKVISY